jgi:hypothetical protein
MQGNNSINRHTHLAFIFDSILILNAASVRKRLTRCAEPNRELIKMPNSVVVLTPFDGYRNNPDSDPISSLSLTKLLGYEEFDLQQDVALIREMWRLGLTDNNENNGNHGDDEVDTVTDFITDDGRIDLSCCLLEDSSKNSQKKFKKMVKAHESYWSELTKEKISLMWGFEQIEESEEIYKKICDLTEQISKSIKLTLPKENRKKRIHKQVTVILLTMEKSRVCVAPPIYIKSQVEYDEIKGKVTEKGVITYRSEDITSGNSEFVFVCLDPEDGNTLFDSWTDRPVIVVDDDDNDNDNDNDNGAAFDNGNGYATACGHCD